MRRFGSKRSTGSPRRRRQTIRAVVTAPRWSQKRRDRASGGARPVANVTAPAPVGENAGVRPASGVVMTTNEDVARRYAEAAAKLDLDAMAALRHPEWQAAW